MNLFHIHKDQMIIFKTLVLVRNKGRTFYTHVSKERWRCHSESRFTSRVKACSTIPKIGSRKRNHISVHIFNPFGIKHPVYNASMLFITLGRVIAGVVHSFTQLIMEKIHSHYFCVETGWNFYANWEILHYMPTFQVYASPEEVTFLSSFFWKFFLQNSVICMSSSWCHADIISEVIR